MKKPVAILFIILSFSIKAICQQEKLDIGGKKLSSHWAHEYSGADLAREYLQTLKDRIELKKVPLAIFDLGFEKDYVTLERDIPVPPQMNGRRTMRANHGTSVANLLTGPQEIRMTDFADLMSLEAITFGSFYTYAFRKYEKNQFYPAVISNSLGWTHSSVPELAKEAYQKDISWFLASGNSFPEPVKEMEVSSHAMLVGSFAPSGLTSANTQNHPELLVLAPSNNELPTIDGRGEKHLFGETSGATPLVAATAINMLSLFPELTVEMIKTIIKGTALPSAEHKLGLTHMPGLLNHYGAIIATYNLRENCRGDIHCAKELLFNGPLTLGASNGLILCEDVIKNSCDKKPMVLENQVKAMRISILLGHDEFQRRQAKELSCVYKNLGLTKNQEFYDFLSRETLDLAHMENEAKKALKEEVYRRSYYRYGPFYSDDYRDYLLNESPMNEYQKKWHLSLETKHIEGIL